VAPDPDAWTSLVVKVNQLDRAGVSWPKERLAALQAPTLLIIGDADVVRPEHTVEMFRLLDGIDTTTHLKLIDTTRFASGIVVLIYGPK
jgi:pimeloyl-ACP methyl ester carboxylesterase